MTAMLLLMVNSMQGSQHDKLSLDNELINAGLQSLDKVLEETQSEVVRTFRDAFTKLNGAAQRRHAEATMMANSLDLSIYFADT
jgi:hypothetical protein